MGGGDGGIPSRPPFCGPAAAAEVAALNAAMDDHPRASSTSVRPFVLSRVVCRDRVECARGTYGKTCEWSAGGDDLGERRLVPLTGESARMPSHAEPSKPDPHPCFCSLVLISSASTPRLSCLASEHPYPCFQQKVMSLCSRSPYVLRSNQPFFI